MLITAGWLDSLAMTIWLALPWLARGRLLTKSRRIDDWGHRGVTYAGIVIEARPSEFGAGKDSLAVTIYFVRHAEAANPKGILYGRLPGVDLSAGGVKQAEVVAQVVAHLHATAIYHSPLLRARRTARIIARATPGVQLHASRLLLENKHPYQGRSFADVAKLGDRAYEPDVLAGAGETIADLCIRHDRFARRLARQHPGEVVIAVGHADPLAAFRSHLLGKSLTVASLRQESPPLTGVYRVNVLDNGGMQTDWYWKPMVSSNGASVAGGAAPPSGG